MKKTSTVIMYIILTIIALTQLFPIYWLFAASLKNNMEIFGPHPLSLPTHWLWSNFNTILTKANVGRYFLNSVIVTAATIAISTIVAAMASYAIARMKWKLSGAVLVIFLMGMMIPIHATLLPLFIFVKKVHLYKTYGALILPYVAFAIPMAVYIFVGFFKTLPRELEEAACLDGSTIYGIFFRIMLPLIRPAIATVSIFTYLSCWNELMFAISFTTEDKYKTLTVGIMGLVGRYATNWGPLAAGLVIATLPTLLIYFAMSSQIQKSFTAGALKG